MNNFVTFADHKSKIQKSIPTEIQNYYLKFIQDRKIEVKDLILLSSHQEFNEHS